MECKRGTVMFTSHKNSSLQKDEKQDVTLGGNNIIQGVVRILWELLDFTIESYHPRRCKMRRVYLTPSLPTKNGRLRNFFGRRKNVR